MKNPGYTTGSLEFPRHNNNVIHTLVHGRVHDKKNTTYLTINYVFKCIVSLNDDIIT